MKDDIISMLFDKKEEDGLFIFENNELDNIRKKCDNNLYNFIEKKVHPKIRTKLEELIENYIDASVESYESKNKHYYIQGFKDGNSILH